MKLVVHTGLSGFHNKHTPVVCAVHPTQKHTTISWQSRSQHIPTASCLREHTLTRSRSHLSTWKPATRCDKINGGETDMCTTEPYEPPLHMGYSIWLHCSSECSLLTGQSEVLFSWTWCTKITKSKSFKLNKSM